MADITISDLELAPALTDDMVLPVENTTDTYAATLAMLRRLINKTFVEVENADFNALTDDGLYQCTGTPTNSPVAGEINWTLQVSAESGVVVQRAFSLDDNFANLYIRRWNGVTWTGWLEVGAGALANKANVSNTVTTDTTQTISGSKRFTQPAEGMSIELTADTNQQIVPTTTTSRQLGVYHNATYTKGDGYTSWIQGERGSDGHHLTGIYVKRLFEDDNNEIMNYVNAYISPEGVPVSYTITPPSGSVGNEIVTAGWFRQSGCTARTVIETYRNGVNWYRVWSDGWIEQGGKGNSGAYIIQNFLKPFSNANYTITATPYVEGSDSTDTYAVAVRNKTVSNFTTFLNTRYLHFDWRACGY